MAKYDVFISYSRADTERIAPLLDELQRLGYRVFFDQKSIEVAEDWMRVLERSVRSSRALILCWSEHAKPSEYVSHEYHGAGALNRPIFPWLLDNTPLPVGLEKVQGIKEPDGAKVARSLQSHLGWPLARRRKLQSALAAVAVIVLGLAGWRILHPPPPPPIPNWEFKGNVIDRITRLPIPGVEVDVMNGNTPEEKTYTDAQGDFDFSLPPPRQSSINLLFRKDGYEGEEPFAVTTDKPFNMDMTQVHAK